MSPPPSSSTGSTPVYIAFIVLTFYGASRVVRQLPLWHIIGETDRWVAYHEALGPVSWSSGDSGWRSCANVLLFVRRPPAVPAWTVAATLSLLLISTASTFAIQIPIQMALDVAYDRAALDHLIWSSLWLRDIPGGIRAAVAAYMLRLVVSGSTQVRVAAARHGFGWTEGTWTCRTRTRPGVRQRTYVRLPIQLDRRDHTATAPRSSARSSTWSNRRIVQNVSGSSRR